MGNEGRSINHFRGIAPSGNVRFRTCAHPSTGLCVEIIVTRAIAQGEEILADYDYGMEAAPDASASAPERPAKRAKAEGRSEYDPKPSRLFNYFPPM